MSVVGHHHRRLKHKPSAVFVNAMAKDHIPRLRRKQPAIERAESNKQEAVVFLIMRQPAPVFISIGDESHTRVASHV